MEPNTEQPVEDNAEQPMETQVEINPARKNRTPLYIALGVCAVILLAAAAFLAGRMMNQQANSPTGPQMILGAGGPDGSGFAVGESAGMVSMEIRMIPAPELPQTQPEVNGLFTRRDDNSIYIGTFNEGMGIIASSGSSSLDDGSPSFETSGPAPSGPEVEVVVTADTKIYYDTTQIDPSNPPQGDIQQEVEEGSLDDLGSDSMVTVWGTRTGDRVVADVIFYTQPMIVMMPAVVP
jgi:hypothetical protein